MLSFDAIAADGRGAFRSLRKRPGYAAACIATLALGIGATTAVFTLVDSVLLERLPYPGAERIGILWHELHHGAQVLPVLNPLDFRDYQERNTSFEAMTLGIGAERVLAGSGSAINVDVGRVAWNFLHFFDGQPHLGRFFHRAEGVTTRGLPQIFRPGGGRRRSVIVRARGRVEALTAALRDQARGLDPRVAVGESTPVARLVDAATAPARWNVSWILSFGITALALTAIGVYGVIAHSMSERGREIAIRLALGAPPRSILALAFSDARRAIALGLTVGLAGAALLAQTFSKLLYGLTAWNVATYMSAVIVLALVSALAVGIPAIRASKRDPVVALHHD